MIIGVTGEPNFAKFAVYPPPCKLELLWSVFEGHYCSRLFLVFLAGECEGFQLSARFSQGLGCRAKELESHISAFFF